MSENIDKAASGGDMLTWSVTFGLLILVAIGLAVWNKIEEKKER